MLKIKDNVDLKELEKFGFKPKYDENTGKIKAYEKIKKEKEYMGLSVTIERIKCKIRIFRRTDTEWRINPYNEYFDEDTLYDLIQAGLVEKVEEWSMSKADEMFEELGFIKTIDSEDFIEYERKDNPFKTITFLKDCKRINIDRIKYLGKRRLQAINEKVKELRWIE